MPPPLVGFILESLFLMRIHQKNTHVPRDFFPSRTSIIPVKFRAVQSIGLPEPLTF